MTYKVQVIQIMTSGELVSQREIEFEDGYAAVPRSCGDCRPRPPLTVPPSPGFSACLVYIHSPHCPRVTGAVGRRAS